MISREELLVNIEYITKSDIEVLFDEQPDIIPLSNKHYYQLRGNYSYIWKHIETEFKIQVPNGFTYDGTSVPRFLWSILGIYPDGLHRPASLIHDYIYHNKGVIPYGSQFTYSKDKWIVTQARWSRKDADRLFCRMLRELNVSKFRRRLMYFAVRTFGYFWWIF